MIWGKQLTSSSVYRGLLLPSLSCVAIRTARTIPGTSTPLMFFSQGKTCWYASILPIAVRSMSMMIHSSSECFFGSSMLALLLRKFLRVRTQVRKWQNS